VTSVRLNALLTGVIAPLNEKRKSAIAKSPVDGPVQLRFAGLEGDFQADKNHHGGPDKAVHLYPFDHYRRWRDEMPNHPRLAVPGGFGENLSTTGLLEDQVCIGDRFRIGTALIEVSQGRKPCSVQGRFLDWPKLPALMVKERRSGWYARVIEEGVVAAGDMLTLVERPLPDWTVKRVFAILIGGDYKSDPMALDVLAAMELLHDGWRARAEALSLRIHG
jgi:MOSC domain-containing protein YiiM